MDWIAQLFKDPYAEARALYGNAFPAMLAQDKWFRDTERQARNIAPELVDEASSQVVGGVEPWRVAWALRQYFGPVNSL